MTIPHIGYNRLDQDTMTIPDASSSSNTSLQTLSEPLTSESTFLCDIKDESTMNVIILDAMQRKFNVAVPSPDISVAEFRVLGAAVHQIPPESQRLIHMGKLLADDDNTKSGSSKPSKKDKGSSSCKQKTLRDYKIDATDKIIHLFPKPKVVVQSSEDETTEATTPNSTNGGNYNSMNDNRYSSGGAHIPQIIMSTEEHSNLITHTAEIFEAQHRVKLFSFLLLVVCSMEILSLITILVGVDPSEAGYYDDTYDTPGNPEDSVVDNSSTPRTWKQSDYYDLAISVGGFYVARLGILASTVHTRQLARNYYLGLVFIGCNWIAYYYIMGYTATKEQYQNDEESYKQSDLVISTLFGMLLPMIVWLTCFVRAYQFSMLIVEAEAEAEERMAARVAQQETAVAATQTGSASGAASDEETGGISLPPTDERSQPLTSSIV
mmetsp:Transcript_50067/g.60220  ORF Transcript_50067/g.60220 Transcript_50067/m.60220 type:complete len:436 (+) Transcript_50067:275-1582(+)